MAKINVVNKLWGNIIGITLWPVGIFIVEKYYLKNGTLETHELIHWRQQQEMLGIFFYLWYVIEWAGKSLYHWENAYSRISFEREAKAWQTDYFYLDNRQWCSWFKYI